MSASRRSNLYIKVGNMLAHSRITDEPLSAYIALQHRLSFETRETAWVRAGRSVQRPTSAVVAFARQTGYSIDDVSLFIYLIWNSYKSTHDKTVHS